MHFNAGSSRTIIKKRMCCKPATQLTYAAWLNKPRDSKFNFMKNDCLNIGIYVISIEYR